MKLLQLALTSNIVSITGSVLNADLITFLTDAIKKLPKLDRLKTLALTTLTTLPLELAFHCKETLETMKLVPMAGTNGTDQRLVRMWEEHQYIASHGDDWKLINRLDEFPRLTSLTLKAGGIKALDNILDNCPQLQALTLTSSATYLNARRMNLENVERHFNLQSLHYNAGYDFNSMMRYLLYKCVAIQEININLCNDYAYAFKQDFAFPRDIPEEERRAYLGRKEEAAQGILDLVKPRCFAKVEGIKDYFPSY